jgi:peptidoglycan/xylan/chitin deacetylase (PgdA/CDA1 family)
MWPETAVAGAAAISGVMYYAVGVPSSQVFGPSLVRKPGGPPRVALTFDDGPSESTPGVLEALSSHHAKATFFQVGSNARRLPDIAHSVIDAGHEVGNHTETHPAFYRRTPAQVAYEIDLCQQSLESVHGRRPALFRPPYGARWFGMYPALRRFGLTSVMWSISSHDWAWPADRVAQRVIQKTASGDVILMHDGDTTTPGDRRQGTARALEMILEALSKRGIAAVTVSELFGLESHA